MTILACPCGKVPESLVVEANGQGAKWANVYGSCCGEWKIEFRTKYFPLDSPDCMAEALKGWNSAPRA